MLLDCGWLGEHWAFACNICPDPVLLVTVPDLLLLGECPVEQLPDYCGFVVSLGKKLVQLRVLVAVDSQVYADRVFLHPFLL